MADAVEPLECAACFGIRYSAKYRRNSALAWHESGSADLVYLTCLRCGKVTQAVPGSETVRRAVSTFYRVPDDG